MQNIDTFMNRQIKMPQVISDALRHIPVEACHNANGEDADEVNAFTPAFIEALRNQLQRQRLDGCYLQSNLELHRNNYPFVTTESDERPDIVLHDNESLWFLAEIKMRNNPDALHDLVKLTGYKQNFNKCMGYLCFIMVNVSLREFASVLRESELNFAEIERGILCYCLHDGQVECRELGNILEG